MKIAHHGLTTMHTNCLTDVRIARDLGYDGVEFTSAKLKRFLGQGYDISVLVQACEQAGIPVTCGGALPDTADGQVKPRDELLAECEMLSAAAEALGCPTLQLVFFNQSQAPDQSWPEIRSGIAALVRELADIGKAHGVQFQLEPIAWCPFHSLSQSLEVIEAAGRDNVGVVIDFWHLWSGRDTTPDEVARLDPDLIYGIHICDGKRPAPGEPWVETELRGYLLGDGDVPVEEWVAAVKVTGYDGVWSPETLSPVHWEYDLFDLARDAKERIEKYVGAS